VTGRFSEIKVKIFYIGVKSVRVFQTAIFPDHKAKAFLSDREDVRSENSTQSCNIEKPSRAVWALAGR
jgi:hypothetical protein